MQDLVIFDQSIFALGITGFFQTLAECAQAVHVPVSRLDVQEPDHRQCRLLRPRRERPRCRAAQECNEVAPSHAICPSRTKAYQRASLSVTAKLTRQNDAMGRCCRKSQVLLELRF